MRPMFPAKPCLPTSIASPPGGPEWLHEIKHDGYRMLAHHDGGRVRLISRRGLDWGDRFPAIVAAVNTLAVRSCIIDGELIACDANGLADFQLLRRASVTIERCSVSLIYSKSTAAISGTSRSRCARSSWRGSS